MKRTKFIKYLLQNGCEKSREGKRHTIFWNPDTNKAVAIPRHSEIKDILVEVICKELGVNPPGER